MAIEARDRKILWARAHNSCAICKQQLVLDATEGDRESVVGDEAHIVAQSSGGPRAGLIPTAELDKYENLILLCKVHHKQVDDQPSYFTVELLRELKTEHENWAKEKFGAAVVAVSGDGVSASSVSELEFFPHVPATTADISYVIMHKPWAWEYLLYAGYLKAGLPEMKKRNMDSYSPRAEFIDDAGEAREYVLKSIEFIKETYHRLGWAFDASAAVEAFGRQGVPGEFSLIHAFAKRFLDIYSEFLSWSDMAKRTRSVPRFERLLGYIAQLADMPLAGMERHVELMVERLEIVLNDEGVRAGNPALVSLNDNMIGIDNNLLKEIVEEFERVFL